MKKKFISLVTAVAMAFSGLALQSVTAVAEDSKKITDEVIKIMPIGDSITHGYQSSGGYRKYFYNFLSEDFNIDMVGPNSDYPETFEWLNEERTYDTNHCGYSGYAIQYMEDNETRQGILETLQNGNILQTYDPDIILLQIGTNDIISNYNEGITDRLENLIKYISDNTRDETVIFVNTIPDIDTFAVSDWFWSYGDIKYNNTPEDFDKIIKKHIDDYNKSMPLLVSDLQNEGINVKFVDVSNKFIDREKHLEDGVHPNEKGYARIGLRLANNIYEYLLFKNADKELEAPYRIADLVSLSNYILGRKNHHITEENYNLYDFNEDGILDSFDFAMLRNIFVEKNMTSERVHSSGSTSSTIVGAHTGNITN